MFARTVSTEEELGAAPDGMMRANAQDVYTSALMDLGSDSQAYVWTWRRIEGWISRRWSARAVMWIVEGPGQWTPPLTPFALETAERWSEVSEDWSAASLPRSPLGYDLEDGAWRVTGTVGDDSDVPPEVVEAGARLFAYHLGISQSFLNEPAMVADGEARLSARWAARAMELSGAADLLRPYRGLGSH